MNEQLDVMSNQQLKHIYRINFSKQINKRDMCSLCVRTCMFSDVVFAQHPDSA